MNKIIQLVSRLSRKWESLRISYKSTNARWNNLR